MSKVQITWARTCEYVATFDTAELRELVSSLPGGASEPAVRALQELEGGSGVDWLPEYYTRRLAYLLGSTETGRAYFGALADDNPELCGGTGAPEITEIRAATAAGEAGTA